uniref:Putative secreted protein n=1 Tax=Panstrongylus lignarius TaxID=156445 RepID=A0A224XWK4_9HEMI
MCRRLPLHFVKTTKVSLRVCVCMFYLEMVLGSCSELLPLYIKDQAVQCPSYHPQHLSKLNLFRFGHATASGTDTSFRNQQPERPLYVIVFFFFLFPTPVRGSIIVVDIEFSPEINISRSSESKQVIFRK